MNKLSATSFGLAVLRIKIYPSSRLFFMITFFFSKSFVGHFPRGNESKWNVFALTHERHRFVYIYLFTRTPSTSDSSFRILFLSGLSFELINPFLFLLILISHLPRKRWFFFMYGYSYLCSDIHIVDWYWHKSSPHSLIIYNICYKPCNKNIFIMHNQF